LNGVAPIFFGVGFGFDTIKVDPTGSFALIPQTTKKIGVVPVAVVLSALVVQESGYRLKNQKYRIRGPV
jgi:acetoin utilization deacetylase AcuC-like enzyme